LDPQFVCVCDSDEQLSAGLAQECMCVRTHTHTHTHTHTPLHWELPYLWNLTPAVTTQ
jgi:hypothetical protein